MKRMKLCLLILPLMAVAAAQAQDHREGRDGGQRGAEPMRGPRGDAAEMRRDEGRDMNRDEQRRDEPRRDEPRRDEPRRDEPRRDAGGRDENRRSEPPRVWASPPRVDGDRDRGRAGGNWDRDHERREQTWNRDMYRPDYWRDNRGSYSRYAGRSYGYYRDYDRHDYDRRDYDRGYYGHRRWSRGERLPYGYYDRSRWERDYWRYDLYDPRDGCGWVRSDGDALLVVLASGLVIDAVYDIFR